MPPCIRREARERFWFDQVHSDAVVHPNAVVHAEIAALMRDRIAPALPAPVPLPASGLLLVAAMLGVAAARRQ
jgi:hypothetical protein